MTNDASIASNHRLASLDAFRGLTIMLMILVNNPGDWSNIYWPLKHAPWHGWTPTDLVFPFFLFIVGVAIPLALTKRKQEGVARGPVAMHIVRRSVILFALGLFLSGFGMLFRLGPDFGIADLAATIRIPGVLQRIAVCYLLASLLFLLTERNTIVVVTAVALLTYWAVMILIPVPGYGAGMIDGKDTHLAAYVDRALLGEAHLWSSAKTWDPEGILSTVPALATTLLGVLTGMWLRQDRLLSATLRGLILAGMTLTATGWLWGLVFPINKSIWTSSYAVFTAGLALLILGVCVWLFDILGWRRLALPLRIYGVNALTVFVMSGVVGRALVELKVGEDSVSLKTWIYENLFHSWLTDVNASLAYAVAWILAWFVVLATMYRRDWIIKV